MRRILPLGTILFVAAIGSARAGDAPYRTLGDLPVLHDDGIGGRLKPLDTWARLAVKQIYGREVVKVPADKEAGTRAVSWESLAALRDWQAHPGAWDERPIILIDMFDDRGFKQRLMTVTIQETLREIARIETDLGEGLKGRIEAVASADVVTEVQLTDLMRELSALSGGKPDTAYLLLERSAKILEEGYKWLPSSLLEEAKIKSGDRVVPFFDFVRDTMGKARETAEGKSQLSAFEKRAIEVGERWIAYMSLRDGNPRGLSTFDLNIIPRPTNAAYLKYTAQAIERIGDRKTQPTPLEEDTLRTFEQYFGEIRARDRKMPGTDSEFDEKYKAWLAEKAAWIPVRLIVDTPIDELERAGFDSAKLDAFRTAWNSLAESEKENAGHPSSEAEQDALTGVRSLAESTGASYPAPDRMARESFYNRLAPFARAPYAYGAALVLLLISLGIAARPGTWVHGLDRVLYGLGLLSFVCGIGLEVVGFYYRVVISGWSPVTNMYETVIWVAFGAAALALVLEAISRKKVVAAAGAGAAFVATILAANVSLLDPNIRTLTPVLQSNYWLAIHVITIVSSYAAFALAMMMGLLGVGYYLSATFRREAPLAKLIWPTVLGIPILVAGGALTWYAPQFAPNATLLHIGLFLVADLGLVLTIGGIAAVVGELSNRYPSAVAKGSLVVAALGVLGFAAVAATRAPAWWPSSVPRYLPPALVVTAGLGGLFLSMLGAQNSAPLRQSLAGGTRKKAMGELDELIHGEAARIQGEAAAIDHSRAAKSSTRAAYSGGSGGGGVATLDRPTVDEIRERMNAKLGEDGSNGFSPSDPREAAMQATAGRIKPLSNFLYRAMQVGVLLVAAGTILGGAWADVSWGRFWGWDPKEVWALITLLVYLVPLHGRFAGWVNTFWLVVLSVVCFSSVLMAWYGVNFVLGVGLHSYGFTEGGGQGIVVATASAVAAPALGAWWRRKLASAPQTIHVAV
jgi:ABC-type transport system involved in cytochrome c biogenesis permease subunit